MKEIEDDVRLRLVLATLLFYFFLTFRFWCSLSGFSSAAPEQMDYIPMGLLDRLPCVFFLDAAWTHFYLQSLALLALLGVLWIARWPAQPRVPMILLAFLTLNKIWFYVGNMLHVANFHHVHLILCVMMLVPRSKLFFLRVGLWTVYWMAAISKMTPSWLWGEYFNSVPMRLPMLPAAPWVITGAGWMLIALEFCAPVMWLARSARVRYTSMALLLLFHAYSGVIVGHWYTALMIPVVIALFTPFDTPLQAAYQPRAADALPWIFVVILGCGAVSNFFIAGDVRLTAEGRYAGLFMFDANRRVVERMDVWRGAVHYRFQVEHTWPQHEVLDWRHVVTLDVDDATRQVHQFITDPVVVDGMIIFNPLLFTGGSSREFGDPYVLYSAARAVCARFHPDRVAIHITTWLDGHEEGFDVVDIDDFARLDPRYSFFGHNAWIRIPGPDAPAAYQWP